MNQFIYEEIIYKCAGNDINNINKTLLRNLFKCFLLNPIFLPSYIQTRIGGISGAKRCDWNKIDLKNINMFVRAIADHIAGMTDNYAKLEFEKINHANKV